MADDRLRAYRDKRSGRSGEPSGDEQDRSRDRPVFVCQRHAASSLHFDFRLEIGGVLVSWAVPKGPSTNPDDKRLAVRTEDHPLDYAEFEGRIGEGEYGGGTVIVWDTGPYANATRKYGKAVDAPAAIEHGHIVVVLAGHKIGGGYALSRTQLQGPGENWLLVKLDDEYADRRREPARTQLESVLTGRTNDDL